MRLLTAFMFLVLAAPVGWATVPDVPLPPDVPPVQDDEPDVLIFDGFTPTADQLVPEMVQVTRSSGGEPRIILASRRGGRLVHRATLPRRARVQEIRDTRRLARTGQLAVSQQFGAVNQTSPVIVSSAVVPRLTAPSYFAATAVCGPNGCAPATVGRRR